MFHHSHVNWIATNNNEFHTSKVLQNLSRCSLKYGLQGQKNSADWHFSTPFIEICPKNISMNQFVKQDIFLTWFNLTGFFNSKSYKVHFTFTKSNIFSSLIKSRFVINRTVKILNNMLLNTKNPEKNLHKIEPQTSE